MQYKRISADSHLDLPWMPPDLFTSMAPRELKDRMPSRHRHRRGTEMDGQERRHLRLQERRRPGRLEVRARQAPPRRHHGRDRPLFRRRQGHPPHFGSASAHQGSRSRRRRRRGDLRHPGRRQPARRPRGRQPDADDLQRLAEGVLQPLSGPAHRPGLPALRRHRRRGEGDLSRRQDGHQGPRAFLLVGHGADVAPDVGAAVEGRERRPAAAALPHLPRRAARHDRQASGPGRPLGVLHRRLGLPDEPGEHPGRHHRRQRAGALSQRAHRLRRERAPAGSPTRSTAWTSNGRTASSTSASR